MFRCERRRVTRVWEVEMKEERRGRCRDSSVGAGRGGVRERISFFETCRAC